MCALQDKQRFLQKLGDKIKESDLKWSCFCSAVESYRHDTVLRPFPPMYLSGAEREKDFTALQESVSKIDSVKKILKGKAAGMTKEEISLMEWVLDLRNYSLTHIPISKFADIKEKTNQTIEAPVPQHLFEVMYSESREKTWAERRGSRAILYAYHGTRFENVHSILNNGLSHIMNKELSLFGKGTYLSEELSVALNWSPMCRAWKHSELGHQLGCVFVCQIIDHPDLCRKVVEKNGKRAKGRRRADDSIGGDVPEKYFVVPNNEILRVKYLLLYGQFDVARPNRASWRTSWLYEYRFTLLMFSYCVLLIAIGVANSRTVTTWWKRYLSKIWPSSNQHV